MRKTLRKITTVLLTVVLALSASVAALAAQTYSDIWKEGTDGSWTAFDKNGQQVTNAWLCDDAVNGNGKNVWYLMGTDGKMIAAGLVQDGTGNYYSIETEHNGYYGMLRYKSGTYDGIYLELESEHNGSFAAIKNKEGIEALKAKYGVTSVADINNSNIVNSSEISGSNNGKSVGTIVGGGSVSGGSVGLSIGGKVTVKQISSTPETSTAAEQDVINNFVSTYISAGMSDFEKEMVIVKWMADHISYDKETYKKHYSHSEGWNPKSYTSEGALIDGLAVCDGYSYAFCKLAAASGLEAVKVGNDSHSWNQVKLGGKWYHVDVTFFDPDHEEREDGLFYAKWCYLNMSDAETEKVLFHEKPWSSYHASNGGEFGTKATDAYFNGKNEDVRTDTIQNNLNKFYDKMLSGGTVDRIFTYSAEAGGKEKTASEIIEYMRELAGRKELMKRIVIRCDDESFITSGHSIEESRTIYKDIESIVNAYDFDGEFRNIIKAETGISVRSTNEAMFKGNVFYYYGVGAVKFEYGNAESEYTVTFINEDDEVVFSQSGTTRKSLNEIGNVFFNAPDGYVMVDKSQEITEGDGLANCEGNFIIRPYTDTFKATARVTKNIKYAFDCYVNDVGIIYSQCNIQGRIGDPIVIPEIEGYRFVAYGSLYPREEDVLYASDNGSCIYLRYEPVGGAAVTSLDSEETFDESVENMDETDETMEKAE